MFNFFKFANKRVKVAYFNFSQNLVRYGLNLWGKAPNDSKILFLRKKVISMYNCQAKLQTLVYLRKDNGCQQPFCF